MDNKKLEEKAVEYEFSGENRDADAKSFGFHTIATGTA